MVTPLLNVTLGIWFAVMRRTTSSARGIGALSAGVREGTAPAPLWPLPCGPRFPATDERAHEAAATTIGTQASAADSTAAPASRSRASLYRCAASALSKRSARVRRTAAPDLKLINTRA